MFFWFLHRRHSIFRLNANLAPGRVSHQAAVIPNWPLYASPDTASLIQSSQVVRKL